MKPAKSPVKSRRPATSSVLPYESSDPSSLNTVCFKRSEPRSSDDNLRISKYAEIANTRYGKDFKKAELSRYKLADKAKRKLRSPENKATKGVNTIYYRLTKQDISETNNYSLAPKWCEIETQECIEMENTMFCEENKRKISVIYKCPELKAHLQKCLLTLSKKLKWTKKLVYNYIITEITPKRIEVKSEINLTSLVPYIEHLENPNLPLWDQLCDTIQSDTGHSIGNIIVNIHMKQN